MELDGTALILSVEMSTCVLASFVQRRDERVT